MKSKQISPNQKANNAELKAVHDGYIEFGGSLNFNTVPQLSLEMLSALNSMSSQLVRISLKHTTENDSSALALILEAIRQASAMGKKLLVIDTPASLYAMAEAADLLELIDWEENSVRGG